MGAMQRRKGAVGEREVAGIIRDWLGVDIQRTWQGQSAQGGSDLSGVPGWSIEIKHAAVTRLGEWWKQAREQSNREGQHPALIWRQTGFGRGLPVEEKWQVRVIPLAVGLSARGHLDMPLITWLDLVRETLPGVEYRVCPDCGERIQGESAHGC